MIFNTPHSSRMISHNLFSSVRAVASSSKSLLADIRLQQYPSSSTFNVQIRTSTKKGGGSTQNNRDSPGQRLGVKRFQNEYVVPGDIIVRQRGTKFHGGQHIGMGRDHTLYALQPGYVKFYLHRLPFPHQTRSLAMDELHGVPEKFRTGTYVHKVPPVQFPKRWRRYIGITENKEDVLPRDQRAEGRERRFWGVPVKRAKKEGVTVSSAEGATANSTVGAQASI